MSIKKTEIWMIIEPDGFVMPWFADYSKGGSLKGFRDDYKDICTWEQAYRRGYRCKKFSCEQTPEVET